MPLSIRANLDLAIAGVLAFNCSAALRVAFASAKICAARGVLGDLNVDMMVVTISESRPGGQCDAIRDQQWNARATVLALDLDSNL